MNYPFPVNLVNEEQYAPKTVGVCNVFDGSGTGGWAVPEETPVAFVFERRTYSIILATPDNLLDFAVGFALSERVVQSFDDIHNLDIVYSKAGIDLNFRLSKRSRERLEVIADRLNRIGNTGCGLCGLKSRESLFAPLPPVAETRFKPSLKVLKRAIRDFKAFQPLNRATRSVHGAAWVSKRGEVLFVREDVGRHNAMDKLLGAILLEGIDVANGFVLISSRCSYELVEKAARGGIRALLSISAPTSFAIRKANEANMTLFARAGEEVVEITAGANEA